MGGVSRSAGRRRRAASAAPGDTSVRKRDADRTRRDILSVATEEFAAHGLSGARVDAIARRMRTTKRMIYYYFGSKAGLYAAVLEQAYAEIRAFETDLKLDRLAPEAAIRRLVEFTFDYDEAHPNFIRLVAIENIHHGRHVAKSPAIRKLNLTVIDTLGALLARGRKAGSFRARIDPVDLHMLISAFCFFRVSNRPTFGAIFGRDLSAPAVRGRHKRLIVDAVLRLLRKK